MEMIKARLEKLRLSMRCDAVLLASGIGSRYLSDFDFSDGYVLVTAENAFLLTDFRYIEAAKKAAGDDFTVIMFEGAHAAQISPILAEAHVTALGYEDRALTCSTLEGLKRDFPLLRFEPVGGLIEDLREYKDETELARIEAAQRIAESALEFMLGTINPDMTEREVALELEYQMRRRGSEGVAFETIAVSGTASALPHGVPRDVKLERGFLTLDFGAVVGGYRSDMTRTVVIGGVTPEMKKVYDTVKAAQEAALEVIAAGKTGAEIDRIARDLIDNAGYKGCFGHGLGHGVGLEIHEAPRLSKGAGDKKLAPGHVVTVEPGIYLEGKFGVRIEDMVVIKTDGAVNLTRAPKELLVI
jgi:Xaa-Pro aminopeptidase